MSDKIVRPEGKTVSQRGRQAREAKTGRVSALHHKGAKAKAQAAATPAARKKKL